MMLHVEFFALIFLIVYVGAIVILFLFMVMMLKIKHVNVSQKLLDFFPYASFIIGIFLLELLAYNKYLGLSSFNNLFLTAFPLNWNDTIFSLAGGESNIESLGKILYSTYLFPFLEAGLILFLAMVGAIVIALDSDNANKDVIKKQQDPINQMVRNSENAIYFSLPNAVKYNKNKTRIQLQSYAKLWQKLS
jgi:NADH-quinone oxidoreductase subunit J